MSLQTAQLDLAEQPVPETEAESRRGRLLAFLSRSEPAWKDEDHPELVELGTEGWVRALRDEWRTRTAEQPEWNGS